MANRFDIWLKTGRPGSEYIYHTGEHLSKRGHGLEFSDQVHSAREAFERGEVTLVQRRLTYGRNVHDIGRFAWIAVKLDQIRKPKAWISKEGVEVRWVSRPETPQGRTRGAR